MRKITTICFGFAVLLGGVTYVAKQKVISLEEELSSINRQILAKKESEHLLRAEWGHLSCPTRLQNLAKNHLKMSPIEGWQVVNVQDIEPNRQVIRQGSGPVRLASAKPQRP